MVPALPPPDFSQARALGEAGGGAGGGSGWSGVDGSSCSVCWVILPPLEGGQGLPPATQRLELGEPGRLRGGGSGLEAQWRAPRWLPQALSFHLPLAFPCLLSPPSGLCLPQIADRPHPNSSQTLSAAQCHRRHLEPCPGGPWDGTGNSLLARASVGAGSGQTDEAANAAGRAVCGDLSPVGLPPPTPSALAPPPRTQRPSGGKGPGVDTGALCLLGCNKPPCVLFSSLSRLPRLLGPDRPGWELGKAWEGH